VILLTDAGKNGKDYKQVTAKKIDSLWKIVREHKKT